MSPARTLVLGGARSGKSTWAERQLADAPARYLATGYPPGDDDAWRERVVRHQRRRPPSWETFETVDVAGQLRAADPRPLLVDCLTLWLTRTCDAAGAWTAPDPGGLVRPAVDDLLAALEEATARVILVSNEVGSGVVPNTASGRLFADLLGELNSAVARRCDRVVLMVAGIPLVVKGDEDGT